MTLVFSGECYNNEIKYSSLTLVQVQIPLTDSCPRAQYKTTNAQTTQVRVSALLVKTDRCVLLFSSLLWGSC